MRSRLASRVFSFDFKSIDLLAGCTIYSCRRSHFTLSGAARTKALIAESIAFSYGRFGVRVSALCPMAVRTALVARVGDYYAQKAAHPEKRRMAALQERFTNART